MSEQRTFMERTIIGTASNGQAPLLEPNEHDRASMDVIRQGYNMLIEQMNGGKVFNKNPQRRGHTLYFRQNESFFVVGPDHMGHYDNDELPPHGEPRGEMTYGGICCIYVISRQLAKELDIPHPGVTSR